MQLLCGHPDQRLLSYSRLCLNAELVVIASHRSRPKGCGLKSHLWAFGAHETHGRCADTSQHSEAR